MKNYYTTQQVADMTGVSLATVNNWINDGSLKAFKTPGGHNRITLEYLKTFLEENNIPLPPSLKGASVPRILVVEDDEDVRDFILVVLDELDYRVEKETAVDGFSAGSRVHAFRPDLVLLDIMLPGVDGFRVCKQIREDFGDKIKVLAMTGYYSDENRRKIMQAGADGFLKKPIVLKELKKKIDKMLLRGEGRFFIEKKEEKQESHIQIEN